MTRRILIASLALLPLTGCLRRHASVYHGPHASTIVVVEKSHRHTNHCGHYRAGGKWFHQRYHFHGHRCGHSFVGGVWELDH